MTTVRDSVREQPLPGEAEAAARSWAVVEAALEARLAADAAARRRRMLPRLALVAGVAGCALLAAFTPAGAWLEERFDDDRGPRPPGFAALPQGGSVLTINRTGAYAVDAEGGSQRLGSFTQAGWSPRGKHVVGVEGRRLVAVTPTGTPKWTLVRPRRVHHPAWSRDQGFAVAYLEGGALRVIAGDGDPATHRLVRRGVAPVTPAWRPGSDTVLTYAAADGGVETVDVTTGARLWRSRLAGTVRALAAAPRGRVVALTPRAVTVLGRGGHPVLSVRLPGAGPGARRRPARPARRGVAPAGRRGARRGGAAGAPHGGAGGGGEAAVPGRRRRARLGAGRPAPPGRVARGRPVAPVRRQAATSARSTTSAQSSAPPAASRAWSPGAARASAARLSAPRPPAGTSAG